MQPVNEVIICGRLALPPQLRKTPSGISVLDMKVAINIDYLDDWGRKKMETCYVDVTCWKEQADQCAEICKKSSWVYVKGRLINSCWTSGNEKRQRLKVRAHHVDVSLGDSEEC